jgi:hypothetical protein
MGGTSGARIDGSLDTNDARASTDSRLADDIEDAAPTRDATLDVSFEAARDASYDASPDASEAAAVDAGAAPMCPVLVPADTPALRFIHPLTARVPLGIDPCSAERVVDVEGVSDDASRIVGLSMYNVANDAGSSIAFGNELFLWSSGAGTTGLGYLPGGPSTGRTVYIDHIAPNLAAVFAIESNYGGAEQYPFRWSPEVGIVPIGVLGPYPQANVSAALRTVESPLAARDRTAALSRLDSSGRRPAASPRSMQPIATHRLRCPPSLLRTASPLRDPRSSATTSMPTASAACFGSWDRRGSTCRSSRARRAAGRQGSAPTVRSSRVTAIR